MFMISIYMEKVFDGVPEKVIRYVLRKKGDAE